MIRLQRVTFLALHDYLGLTTELTRSSDDPTQLQTPHRTHGTLCRRSHTHPSLISHAAKPSTDALNNTEDDSVDNESFPPSRSDSTMLHTAPLSDQTQTTTTPDLIITKNEFESVDPPKITERTGSIQIPVQKTCSSDFLPVNDR